ncbi:MAG: penicillin acylase family protein, partial [Mangrovicoccus sp.]
MNALYRWMLRSLLACLLLALLGLGFAYFLVSRSLPNYEAQYRLPGLSGQVEITRDISAVPHIFADHAEDVYFGLGFVHAQDRLWQMTMLRRT